MALFRPGVPTERIFTEQYNRKSSKMQWQALAYSKQGQALLEGFNFFKIQNACMMPDRVPLFACN
jgi:hypothetical protein